MGLDEEEEGCLSRSRSDTARADTSRPASRARSARSSGGKSFAAELRQLTSTMTGARHFFFGKKNYHPLFFCVPPSPKSLLCSSVPPLLPCPSNLSAARRVWQLFFVFFLAHACRAVFFCLFTPRASKRRITL